MWYSIGLFIFIFIFFAHCEIEKPVCELKINRLCRMDVTRVAFGMIVMELN